MTKKMTKREQGTIDQIRQGNEEIQREKLAELLSAHNIHFYQAAARLNLHQTALSAYLNGHRPMPAIISRHIDSMINYLEKRKPANRFDGLIL